MNELMEKLLAEIIEEMNTYIKSPFKDDESQKLYCTAIAYKLMEKITQNLLDYVKK